VNWKFCAQWGLLGLLYWTGMLAINDDELLWPGLGSWRTSLDSSQCRLPPCFLCCSHPYLKLEGKFSSALHANILVTGIGEREQPVSLSHLMTQQPFLWYMDHVCCLCLVLSCKLMFRPHSFAELSFELWMWTVLFDLLRKLISSSRYCCPQR
jgi:hypothetical protein